MGELTQEKAGEREIEEGGDDNWIIWVIIFIVGGISGAVSSSGNILPNFIAGGLSFSILAAIIWIAIKISQDSNQSQTQKIGSSPQSKQTCPHCGWQNPSRNSYCHDCGGNLNNEEVETGGGSITIQEEHSQNESGEEEFEREG